MRRQEASCRPEGLEDICPPQSHPPHRGSGRNSLLLWGEPGTQPQHGKVRVTTASLSPQSGRGKKAGVQNGKQLFTALLGMREQSQVTQSKDGAADGGTLGGRSLQQGYGTLQGKVAVLSPRASPLQCIAAQSAFFVMMT